MTTPEHSDEQRIPAPTFGNPDATLPASTPPPSMRELATDDAPAEEGLPSQVIRVVLEDGTRYEVRSKNKDYIRWDKTPPSRRGGVKDFSEAPFIFTAFLGWAAGRREELHALTFDQFLDQADVVSRIAVAEVPPTR